MEQQYHITFTYKDEYSYGDWLTGRCTLYASNEREAAAKCVELFGLGVDCEYEITSIEEVN